MQCVQQPVRVLPLLLFRKITSYFLDYSGKYLLIFRNSLENNFLFSRIFRKITTSIYIELVWSWPLYNVYWDLTVNLHTKLRISQVYCMLRDYFYIITVLFSLSMTNVALMTFCCIGLGLQVKVSKQVKGTFNTFQFAIGGFVIVIICYFNQSLAKNIQ